MSSIGQSTKITNQMSMMKSNEKKKSGPIEMNEKSERCIIVTDEITTEGTNFK